MKKQRHRRTVFKCRYHFTFLITPMVFNMVDFKKLLIEPIFIWGFNSMSRMSCCKSWITLPLCIRRCISWIVGSEVSLFFFQLFYFTFLFFHFIFSVSTCYKINWMEYPNEWAHFRFVVQQVLLSGNTIVLTKITKHFHNSLWKSHGR